MTRSSQPPIHENDPNARLSRQIQRYRRINCLALLALPTLFLLAASGDPMDEVLDNVRTSRLEIVDESGEVRLRLMAKEQGAVLELDSATGEPLARLGAGTDGQGTFTLMNSKGSSAVRAWATATGHGMLVVDQAGGKRAAELLSSSQLAGAGALNLYGEDGERFAYVGPGNQNGGSLWLMADGKPIFRASGDANGNGDLVTFGSGGRIGFQASANASGAGFLAANAADGKRIAFLGAGGATGEDGVLVLDSKDGNRLFYAGTSSNGGHGLVQVGRKDGSTAIQLGISESNKAYVWTDRN